MCFFLLLMCSSLNPNWNSPAMKMQQLLKISLNPGTQLLWWEGPNIILIMDFLKSSLSRKKFSENIFPLPPPLPSHPEVSQLFSVYFWLSWIESDFSSKVTKLKFHINETSVSSKKVTVKKLKLNISWGIMIRN